jgi:hypothetical protein
VLLVLPQLITATSSVLFRFMNAIQVVYRLFTVDPYPLKGTECFFTTGTSVSSFMCQFLHTMTNISTEHHQEITDLIPDHIPAYHCPNIFYVAWGTGMHIMNWVLPRWYLFGRMSIAVSICWTRTARGMCLPTSRYESL